MIVPLAFDVTMKHLIIVALLAVATGIYFFVRGLRVLARGRPHIATASKTGSALPGLVEINGIATGPNTISGPITGQTCYVYRTTIWQQGESAKQEWEKVAEESLQVPFFLNDSTGQLLIEPRGADLDLQSEFHKEYDPSVLVGQSDIPRSVSLFLARHEFTPARRIRIEEYCVRPESVVFITGTVAENLGVEVLPTSNKTEDAPQSRRRVAPEVIRLSISPEPRTSDAMTQQSKIAAALVKAGIQQPNAWESAGEPNPATDVRGGAEAPEFLPEGKRKTTQSKSPSQSRPTPALVLMKGPEDAPFLISWRRREEVGRAYVRQGVLILFGGAILTLAGVYLLLLTTNVL